MYHQLRKYEIKIIVGIGKRKEKFGALYGDGEREGHGQKTAEAP